MHLSFRYELTDLARANMAWRMRPLATRGFIVFLFLAGVSGVIYGVAGSTSTVISLGGALLLFGWPWISGAVAFARSSKSEREGAFTLADDQLRIEAR